MSATIMRSPIRSLLLASAVLASTALAFAGVLTAAPPVAEAAVPKTKKLALVDLQGQQRPLRVLAPGEGAGADLQLRLAA